MAHFRDRFIIEISKLFGFYIEWNITELETH